MEQNPRDVLCRNHLSCTIHHHVVPANFSGEVNFGLSPLLAGLVAFSFPVCLVGLFVFCFGINSASYLHVGTKLMLNRVRHKGEDINNLLPINCGPASCK